MRVKHFPNDLCEDIAYANLSIFPHMRVWKCHNYMPKICDMRIFAKYAIYAAIA